MKKSLIISAVLGMVGGALLAGCCEPVGNAIKKGKKAVAEKMKKEEPAQSPMLVE
jgi:hypothetical protein